MSRLYILIRNDLPSLNYGKAIAQASHAVSQFLTKYPESKNWCEEADGFGTTIVMEGSKRDIDSVMERIIGIKGKIIDPTYPFRLQKEIIPYLKEDADITYDLETMDKYGMVDATRSAHTVSWIYVDKEEDVEPVKSLMDELNIKLFH